MPIKLNTASGGGVILTGANTASDKTITVPAVDGNMLYADSSGNAQINSGYGSLATGYVARAWVNFNGTGTVAIRASGNVSSITDNGVGDYTVNFTTAMSDANYSSSVFCVDSSGFYTMPIGINYSKSTASYRLGTMGKNNSATIWSAYTADFPSIDVSVFR